MRAKVRCQTGTAGLKSQTVCYSVTRSWSPPTPSIAAHRADERANATNNKPLYACVVIFVDQPSHTKRVRFHFGDGPLLSFDEILAMLNSFALGGQGRVNEHEQTSPNYVITLPRLLILFVRVFGYWIHILDNNVQLSIMLS